MKKSMYCMVLSGALCAGAYSYGDTISVHNTTQETLYVAPYYLRNEAERLQGPLEIKAGQTVQIERPARKYWYDRELAYTPDPETLKAKFDKITFDTLSHVNIGLTQGSHFYLAAKDGRLKSYTALQWHITHPLSKAVGSVTSLMTEPIRNYIKDRA
ncbi:MAG TPA: hypothetical protein VEK38_00895, partial [Candidatus Bathyarchaeia archaeon]|nr:hypothetical protein [Candidatus Bathyarchaeia archaeon]